MRSSHLTMLLVFAGTLFLSALLLFLVQPMVGKMILPMLGGSPAVWNTCMVFFQAMLLAGYAYAHATTSWLGPRKQAILHLALLAVPFVVLPIAVKKDLAPSGDANPVVGVLVLLTAAVGLPFFIVSATAPLLQKWFASTDHPAAKDPYFLYGASNLGSMLALAFYPWLIEPELKLAQQSLYWTAGYGLLLLLTAACAVLMWRSATAPVVATADGAVASIAIAAAPLKKKKRAKDQPALDPPATGSVQRPVTAWRRLHWIALAFVPSSLMLGATTYITTDIAAIPLLWVVPLALYLLSFIIVFSREPSWLHKGMILLMPLMVLLLAFMMLSGMKPKEWQYILFHPLVLFVVAMVCHGELARDRPAAAHLTEFYLWMSVGGVLGGMFNALLAPILFNGLVEYQLAFVLACLLMPRLSDKEGEGFGYKIDLALTGCLIVATFAVSTVGIVHLRPSFNELKEWFDNAVSNGWDIPSWVPPRLANLENQLLIMKLLRGMAVLLALLAPLALFLSRNPRRRALWFDWVQPAGMGLLSMALLFAIYGQSWEFESLREFIRERSGNRFDFTVAQVSKLLVFGLPALTCYLFVERPLRFGLAFGALVVASALYDVRLDPPLHQERSYFGVLKINTHKKGDSEFHILTHGTTTHGMQCMDPQRRGEPMTYYHRNGPVGQLFAAYPELAHNYAVIGLGTGTMSAYGGSENRVTFYEIDRHVKQIAENPQYFTYLTDYKNRRNEDRDPIVLGDARLQLEKAKDKYGIIVVDAFSSDAIPVHLITLEALRMYFDKLTDDGIIAFHISNRWLDLVPVLHHLTEATRRVALINHDYGDQIRGWDAEWYQSSWVVIARRKEDLERLVHKDWYTWPGRSSLLALSVWPDGGLAGVAATLAGVQEKIFWEPLQPDNKREAARWEKVGVWTDDYSNLLSVFNWQEDKSRQED